MFPVLQMGVKGNTQNQHALAIPTANALWAFSPEKQKLTFAPRD